MNKCIFLMKNDKKSYHTEDLEYWTRQLVSPETGAQVYLLGTSEGRFSIFRFFFDKNKYQIRQKIWYLQFLRCEKPLKIQTIFQIFRLFVFFIQIKQNTDVKRAELWSRWAHLHRCSLTCTGFYRSFETRCGCRGDRSRQISDNQQRRRWREVNCPWNFSQFSSNFYGNFIKFSVTWLVVETKKLRIPSPRENKTIVNSVWHMMSWMRWENTLHFGSSIIPYDFQNSTKIELKIDPILNSKNDKKVMFCGTAAMRICEKVDFDIHKLKNLILEQSGWTLYTRNLKFREIFWEFLPKFLQPEESPRTHPAAFHHLTLQRDYISSLYTVVIFWIS